MQVVSEVLLIIPLLKRAGGLFDLPAVEQGVGDRQFVDVFQLVAEADAPGDGGNFQFGKLPQAVHQVEERRPMAI